MIDTLLQHGAQLLAGSTLLLALGCLAVRVSRRPLHAQRRGELCLLAVLLFVPAALLPLPRHGRDALDAVAAALRGADAERPIAVESPSAAATPGALPTRRADTVPGDAAPSHVLRTHLEQLAAAGSAPALGTPRDSDRDRARRAPHSASTPSASEPHAATSSQPAASAASRTAGASSRTAGATVDEFAPLGAVAPRRAGGRSDAPVRPALAEPRSVTPPHATTASPRADAAGPTPTSAPPADVAPALDSAHALAALFLAGAALSLAWLLLGVTRLRRVLRETWPAPAWLEQWIAEAAPDLRLRVLIGPAARSPFCVGLLRQTIVIPPALLHGGRRGLHSVLRHELAHARHGDGRGRLLTALALPLLWFHPLYWWLRRRIALSAELLADDQAAADDRPAYARELLDLVQRLPRTPALPAGARPVFGAPLEFSRRIEMLLQRRDRLDTRCSAVARGAHSLFLVALVMLGGTVFGAAPASAQSADALQAKAQIEKLHAERAELRAQVDRMHAEMNALRAQMADLHSELLAGREAQLHAEQRARDPHREALEAERMQLELERAVLADELAQVEWERELEARERAELEAEHAQRAHEKHALAREAELHAEELQALHHEQLAHEQERAELEAELAMLAAEQAAAVAEDDATRALAQLKELEARAALEAARAHGRPGLVDPYASAKAPHAAHGHGRVSGGGAGGVAAAPHASHGFSVSSGGGTAAAPHASHGFSSSSGGGTAAAPRASHGFSVSSGGGAGVAVVPAAPAAPSAPATAASPAPSALPAPAVSPTLAVPPTPAVAPAGVPVPAAPAAPEAPAADLSSMLDMAQQIIDVRTELDISVRALGETAQLVEKSLVPKSQLHVDEAHVRGLELRLGVLERAVENRVQQARHALERAQLMLKLAGAKLDAPAAELERLAAHHRVVELEAQLELLEQLH